MQKLNERTSVNLSEVLRRLDEVDVTLDGLPPEGLLDGRQVKATLRGADRHHEIAVVASPSMTLGDVLPVTERLSEPPLLVVGPGISERTADAFRRAGINYADELGNSYIRLSGVLVDVRGRKGHRRATRSRMEQAASGAMTKPNLFSVKRAQVIFALLAWPDLYVAPLRRISYVAGVSLGQASETFSLLEELGYLDKRTLSGLIRRNELLEGWLLAYPTGLGRSTQLHDFEGSLDEIHYLDPRGVVSGEYAVPELIKGHSLTMYVPETKPRMIIANRWKPGPRPNIHLRHKFWDEAEMRPHASLPQMAPPLIIYADLLMSGEGRQVEAAREFRERHEL